MKNTDKENAPPGGAHGKAAVVRGRVNAHGRFPVTVDMRDGPETIALRLANLRAADE